MEVDRQIRMIADFVELESREKAAEIRARAKADADAEKQIALVNAKEKMAEEYDRKEKLLAVDLKINASMAEAKQRSRLLAARHKFLDRLAKETEARLRASMASAPQAYHGLLKGLIKQAIQRLDGEQVVEVHARPVDLAVAKAATQVAVGEVMAAAKAAGRTLNITATTVADPSLAESSGGVVVTALNGRIRCNNTLEDRLKLVLHDLTPVIRDLLFPSAKAVVKTKPAIYFPHQVAHAAPPAAGGAAAHHAPAAAAVAAPVAAAVVAQQQQAPVVVAAPVPEVVVAAPAIVSAGGEKDPFAF